MNTTEPGAAEPSWHAHAAHLAQAGAAIDDALAALQLQGVVIHAGTQHRVFLDDQHYPFRPSPWFLWLAPLVDAPDSFITWEPGKRPRLVVVIPDDYWYLPPTPPSAPWTAQFDLQVVADARAALAHLPGEPRHWAWLGEVVPPPGWSHVNPAALLRRLEQARCTKSAHELSCMAQASRLAAAGHLAARRAFEANASEFGVQLALLAATGMTDPDLPYPAIVGINQHAATLHYQRRDTAPPATRRSLLIDAGASIAGYAADVTRTWAGRDAPQPFLELLDGMEALQQSLCDGVVAGTPWLQLHLAAHQGIARLMRAVGLLHVDADEAMARGLTRPFFPHGLGHLLGLQVHDVGGFHATAEAGPMPPPSEHAALRLTRTLQPGFVVTVEPGIYFIPSLLQRLRNGPDRAAVDWRLVGQLVPCGGIRIEDNLVVTTGLPRNLTREAFRAA